MKSLLLAFVCLVAYACALQRSSPVLFANNPVANPAAIVIVGNARFTVLTSRLIRMEYAPNATFDDRATLAVLNRNLPVPKFTSALDNATGIFTLDTGALTVKYAVGVLPGPAFAPNTLSITINGWDNVTATWNANATNSGNLLGTIRTLDGVNGSIDLNCTEQTRLDLHCTFGLVSTLGWALVDESQRPAFDNDPVWPWCQSRSDSPAYDWYFLGHGLNYKLAISEYTSIGGPIPLPPRFAFGIWWSRYWAFSDIESMELVNEYEMHTTPLDVLVTDMDWHMTFYKEANEGEKDQAGLPVGWTGYTWDPNLFPNPKAFLDFCKTKGLKNTLNLHPASGVQPHEEFYPQMAIASGINPATKIYVPFDIENKTYANNLWNIMLQPREEEGIDFWWLDWQQGEDVSTVPGINPTFWLNYVFFTNPNQWANQKRPILFHRWGGLGNHRYQLGFTGDVVPSWESLQFQPYFTATAANVGFGFWSHDIGGHTLPSPPEVYTRWVQWGVFAPILRTHCTKSPINDRRIWAYPLPNFFVMRDAMILRAELVPYIYTAARITHDTGVPFLRSLYYDYPFDTEAYNYPGQYVFGDDMIVQPVTQPVSTTRNVAEVNVWIPAGDWIEWFSGLFLTGPMVVTRAFALTDIPVYVRAGSIIPMVDINDRPLTGGAQLTPSTLSFRVFHCPQCSGATSVYEDDGDTTQYAENATSSFAWTDVSYKSADNIITVQIGAPSGSYPGFPTSRNYRVIVQGAYDPTTVTVNGQPVAFDVTGQTPNSWSYDGNSFSVVVLTAPQPVSTVVTVVITTSSPTDTTILSGISLAINRLAQVKTLLDNQWENVFQEDYQAVIFGASTAQRMSSNPSSVAAELGNFTSVFNAALAQITALTNIPAVQPAAEAMVSSAQPDMLSKYTPEWKWNVASKARMTIV